MGTEMRYPEFVEMDIKRLAQLLMTTSGVFMAVEKNNEKHENIEKWLLKELEQFYQHEEKLSFKFDMSVWCIKRIPRPELNRRCKL